MKRFVSCNVGIIMAVGILISFAGCTNSQEGNSAKEYTLVLDYQGAAVTGSRQLTVEYGKSLPELPQDLKIAHKDFVGWFTAKDCGGVQVSDEYGLIPVVSVLNEENFDLSGDYVYIYAGFATEICTVTLHFGGSTKDEKYLAPYGKPVSEIVSATRVDGNAVLTWSATQGGEAFKGDITEDTDLYAIEFAPVIDFDENGGKYVPPVVARAGSAIKLPTPEKELAEFLLWSDSQGNAFDSAVMPDKSISLKAVWQAKIVFDENGGTEVKDISEKAGEKITLVSPEREGYIFAGWYTADKELYTSTEMPSAGVALKAGWYEEKTEKLVLLSGTQSSKAPKSICEGQTYGPRSDWKKEIDLSAYLPKDGGSVSLKINAKMAFGGNADAIGEGGFYFYDDVIISDSNLLGSVKDTVSGLKYKSYTFELQFKMRSDTLYMYYYEKVKEDVNGSMWKYVYFSDIWIDLTYPDTANLHL